jgi:bifunctional non-homologous end joining protein LigD
MVLRPMLARSADELPVGREWTYEVKWDGYRALAVKDGARVQLLSRNQKDLTRDYPTVVAAVKALPAGRSVLDGEIVAVDDEGRPSFQALQHRATTDLAVVYYAFDVLQVDKETIIRAPLEARRRRLVAIAKGSSVLLSEALPGTVEQIERAVRRLGLEGIVAKRLGSIYRPGQRSDDWVKVKFSPRQEFVIGGYKPADPSFESMLVGYYKGSDLYFAGKVRAGLTPHLRAEVYRRIARRPVKRCPFVNLPNSAGRSHWGEGITDADMATLRWVKPMQVVEVAFVEWTRDGLLRHPRFIGLRDDKSPRDVQREPLAQET